LPAGLKVGRRKVTENRGDGYDWPRAENQALLESDPMPVNLDKPHLWKGDIAQSVDYYNSWFLTFAPKTYRQTRIRVTKDVESMLKRTSYLRNITADELRHDPAILPALRMSTAPPLARDRLVGLAGVPRALVEEMEKNHRLPLRMSDTVASQNLEKIVAIVTQLMDSDIFPWLLNNARPSSAVAKRAATIIADRLCGASADPINRNAQERRQLAEIKQWLEQRGYRDRSGAREDLTAGDFAFRRTIAGLREDRARVSIPVDCVVVPLNSRPGNLPVMIEAKSAGDFANVNKRRQEEAAKVLQLRRNLGPGVGYVLFLCGYFDSGYLGYEAAEGIDWVWEHRIDDLSQPIGDFALNRREKERLDLQARLDSVKTQSERNRIGQFATPSGLAMEIVQAGLRFLEPNDAVHFLDPGFGTGSFFSALLHLVSTRELTAASGFEIDPHYGEPAQQLWKNTLLDLRPADFTKTDAPDSEKRKANLVICNPPYVRHHHLDRAQKQFLAEKVERQTGLRLNGLSGLYCYFLLLSQAWMTNGGVGIWLIPSEFMDVNYGRQVKRFLLNHVRLLRIHRFPSADVQFADALVSSAVVFFRNEQPCPDARVEFTLGGLLDQPQLASSISPEQLERTEKWTSLIGERSSPSVRSSRVLSDLFRIQRGIATGCNSFFVLTPEQVEQHGIPRKFLRPILPSPRHLSVDEITADGIGDPILENTRFLLDCDLNEAQIQQGFPRLWGYIQSGRTAGIDQRYLCLHRNPWYAQERRRAAPFLCTYMGRFSHENRAPFRFILNHSRAVAANVYLLMYPNPKWLIRLLESTEARRAVWRKLQTIADEFLAAHGRQYGGGLHKIEPKELANAPADALLEFMPPLRRQKQPVLFDS
jgi:predicted RNA methylase